MVPVGGSRAAAAAGVGGARGWRRRWPLRCAPLAPVRPAPAQATPTRPGHAHRHAHSPPRVRLATRLGTPLGTPTHRAGRGDTPTPPLTRPPLRPPPAPPPPPAPVPPASAPPVTPSFSVGPRSRQPRLPPPAPPPPLGTPPWPPRRPRVDRPLVATPSPALSPRGLELRHLRAREPVATSPELGTPLAPGTYVPTGANPRGTVLGPSPGPFPPLCLSFPSRRGLDLRGTGLWDSPGDTRVAKHPPPRSTHRCQPWGHTTGCHRRWQRPR